MMLIFVVVIGGLLLLPGHILYLRGIYKRRGMEEEKRGIAFGFIQLQLKNNLEEVVFSSSAERTLLFTNIISLPRRFSVYIPRLPALGLWIFPESCSFDASGAPLAAGFWIFCFLIKGSNTINIHVVLNM